MKEIDEGELAEEEVDNKVSGRLFTERTMCIVQGRDPKGWIALYCVSVRWKKVRAG